MAKRFFTSLGGFAPPPPREETKGAVEERQSTLLQIRDLDVRFTTPDSEVHALKNVSLDVNASECLGVVGESGSGKSQLFLACLGLLAANGRATGSVLFRDRTSCPSNSAPSTACAARVSL